MDDNLNISESYQFENLVDNNTASKTVPKGIVTKGGVSKLVLLKSSNTCTTAKFQSRNFVFLLLEISKS